MGERPIRERRPRGRSARPAGRAASERGKPKPPKSERLRALLPDLWALVRPRRGALLLGFVLMAVNRVAGLVLPASTKFLIDDVIGRRASGPARSPGGAVVVAPPSCRAPPPSR